MRKEEEFKWCTRGQIGGKKKWRRKVWEEEKLPRERKRMKKKKKKTKMMPFWHFNNWAHDGLGPASVTSSSVIKISSSKFVIGYHDP